MDIIANDAFITVNHPDLAQQVRIPRHAIIDLDAEVSERWVANAVLTARQTQALVPPPFLKPTPTPNGIHVVSLCAIFMRHAAPTWAPLRMGPGSHNCAIRVACTDLRTGDDVAWVDHRFTDSPFAKIIGMLGFPPVHGTLTVQREEGQSVMRHLQLTTGDHEVDLDLRHDRLAPPPLAFDNAASFHNYFCAGIRSYGPGPQPDWFSVVDLEKRSNNHFEESPHLRGRLSIHGTTYGVDGVYLTRDGHYRWHHAGWCDRDGAFLTAAQRAA